MEKQEFANKQIRQKLKKKGTMVKKNVKSVNTINQKEIPLTTINDSISNITSPDPHTYVFSDLNTTKDNNHPNRKRKLYSTKFEQIDSDMSEKGITKKQKTEPINTFDKDIKTQTKTRIHTQPKRRNRSKQVLKPPSPRTESTNKIFDQLKETQDNTDDVVYADKNEYDVFNYSSDSDDFRENVKMLREKNKNNISAHEPVTVNETTNNKTKSRRNYVRKNINTVENNKMDSIKSKLFKSKLVSENKDLVDEKMGSATSVLNNSILLEKPTVVNEEPVLVLDNMPEMEFIGDSVNNGELSNNADKSQSPLPELLLEPALPIHQNNTDEMMKIINRVREIRPDFNVDLLTGNESNLRPMEEVDITANSTRTSKSVLAATSSIHSIKKSATSSIKSRKGHENRRENEHHQSCHNSKGSEKTRSKLSAKSGPRVILEATPESSESHRRSDIEDESVKVNSRKAVMPITTMRVADTGKQLRPSTVTKTSINKKLPKRNNTANNIEASERLQSRLLLSKTANDVSNEKNCGVKAITENASSNSPKVTLLRTIKNVFGMTESSTPRAQGTEAHATDISDRTTTPILKTVPTTLNIEEDSRIETLNNEGIEEVHQCVSSSCLFCEWEKKDEAASSTGCKEKNFEELKDALEHICEKLDVKLTEVSEAAQEKHAYVFIQILKELVTMQLERIEQIAELTQQWDMKLSSLKEAIKEYACKMIKEEFEVKEAIVKKFRDDATAVKDFISKK